MELNKLHTGDCIDIMRSLPDRSVDLTFTSPPYQDARTYGIDFNLTGQEWVDWCVERFKECLRVTKGLIAWVVQGRTRNYRWNAAPALLMSALHKANINLREPPIYHRSGIPGSGGPDWLRRDYEWIICASHPGRLPWSDNTAMGEPPKFQKGGEPTHRLQDGRRIRVADGKGKSIKRGTNRGNSEHTKQIVGAEVVDSQPYIPPKIANPGNIIRCSGGHLGHPLAHENEAPFPEALAEFFIRSFCPPDGTVLDPFMGSGTTCCVAKQWSRNYVGVDVRQSQIDLTTTRLLDY